MVALQIDAARDARGHCGPFITLKSSMTQPAAGDFYCPLVEEPCAAVEPCAGALEVGGGVEPAFAGVDVVGVLVDGVLEFVGAGVWALVGGASEGRGVEPDDPDVGGGVPEGAVLGALELGAVEVGGGVTD